MSLESELKKNTAALVALTEAMSSAQSASKPASAPGAPTTAVPPPPVPTTAPPAVAAVPVPATVAPPVQPSQPAPAKPAADPQHEKMVLWARQSLQPLLGVIGEARFLELLTEHGVASLSELSLQALPGLVAQVQQEASVAAQGVPQ